MIRVDIKRTDFYNELESEISSEYFSTTYCKYLPEIDNIYYSVFLEADSNDNSEITGLLRDLEHLKDKALTDHEPQDFECGLMVDYKIFNLYKYCITNPDLYDIFVIKKLPNNETPRILVQLRAHGLWIHGSEKMLTDSLKSVADIFENMYRCKISRCRENRIDFCYHTNAILNPEKIFSDKNINNHMSTTLSRYHQTGRIKSINKKISLKKDYFALGERKSNNVFIRCYNKALEVIEEGYKGFFFEIWLKNGLISFYDKYCFEYAYKARDYDHVHKAKLEFYLEYGTDELVKKEFKLSLDDTKMTLSDYKDLASKYMPEVSTIMNIEFETKRKFYYYSDEIIDTLKIKERENIPETLNRIFRITDNRSLFLDYLTSVTLCFRQSDDKYSAWWERLRNTKLEGFKPDEKLLRKYSAMLDELMVKRRFVNNVATTAVYNDNLESDFLSDVSDLLSNLNDNHMRIVMFDENGEFFDCMNSKLLENYQGKKMIKEKRLKNRKKKINNEPSTGE